MNAGVDKLGFNKLGGGVLLAGWIVILVVRILHGAYGVRPEHALPMATNKQSSLPWSAWECRLEQLWRFARLLCAPTFKPPPRLPSGLLQAGQISYEDAKELHWAAVFWRTGSIIFGGGQASGRGRWGDDPRALSALFSCCVPRPSLSRTHHNLNTAPSCLR